MQRVSGRVGGSLGAYVRGLTIGGADPGEGWGFGKSGKDKDKLGLV